LRGQAGQDALVLALDAHLDARAAAAAELADRRGGHFPARDVVSKRARDL